MPSTLVVDDPRESRPNRHNDLAFGIERHHGDPLTLFVAAALNAHLGILEIAEERGTGLDETAWSDLVAGFDTLVRWPADPTRLPAPLPVPGCAPSGSPNPSTGSGGGCAVTMSSWCSPRAAPSP